MPSQLSLLNIRLILDSSIQRLEHLGFDEARLNIELLLSSVTGLSRTQLYTQGERMVSPVEAKNFDALLDRRLRHEPVQYILGKTYFMGMEFLVNEHVLIPRPETEILVERAIEIVSGYQDGCRVLDIGTGSGNIAISIAHGVPGAKVTAVDINAAALEVAKMNAHRLKAMQIDFQQCDVLRPYLQDDKFDVIVANPPYISSDEFDRLEKEVYLFEPRIALTDGHDGYIFIRRIVEDAQSRLNAPGVLLMEVAYNQGVDVRDLALTFGYTSVLLRKDLQGIDRIIEARKE